MCVNSGRLFQIRSSKIWAKMQKCVTNQVKILFLEQVKILCSIFYSVYKKLMPIFRIHEFLVHTYL